MGGGGGRWLAETTEKTINCPVTFLYRFYCADVVDGREERQDKRRTSENVIVLRAANRHRSPFPFSCHIIMYSRRFRW